MIGIYKITNPEGKIYIGQSIDIERRFKSYKSNRKDQKAIYNSMQRYGIERHLFEVLEECDRDDLNQREKHYIEKYNSYNSGLNCNVGGNFQPIKTTYDSQLNQVSISYVLKWQLKNMPQYKFSTCGRMFNCKTGKLLKRTVNGGSIGYWIGKEFMTLKQLRTQIELIPKQICPF